MSRVIDVAEGPLSGDDRQYLLDRDLYLHVEYNDQEFGGTEPEHKATAPGGTADPGAQGRATTDLSSYDPDDVVFIQSSSDEELRKLLVDANMKPADDPDQVKIQVAQMMKNSGD